jgi:hypothetical protein
VIAPPKVIAAPETIWKSPAAPRTGSVTALADVGTSAVVVISSIKEQEAKINFFNDIKWLSTI